MAAKVSISGIGKAGRAAELDCGVRFITILSKFARLPDAPLRGFVSDGG